MTPARYKMAILSLTQLVTYLFEEVLGRLDSLFLRQLAPFIFDTHETAVFGSKDDLHHLAIISVHFITLSIKIVRFRTHCVRIRHQFLDALITIIGLIVTDTEVPKIRKCSAIRQINFLHHTRQLGAI